MKYQSDFIKNRLLVAITAGIFSLSAIFSFSACSKATSSEQVATEIKIGVVGEHNEPWESVARKLEKSGIKITLVKFADYTLPNSALNDGEIDLNSFQHVAFLNNDIAAHGYKIERFGNTVIVPLGVYSTKIKSLNELKEGDTIAIPNDPTNGGRALKVLELAGVISLNPEKGYLPTVRDIIKNSKNIKIYEVDAGNTPSLLPDVAACVINSNYAVDNNIDLKSAIFSDSIEGKLDPDNPYINIVAVSSKRKNDAILKRVVKAYQTKETATLLKTLNQGVQIPAFDYRRIRITSV
ncbi:MAG TPA: metal ABC transporter substrate-binding protein [Succinivibrionaceae bacterium]|nr:metal ABC transporter substrate-binding protein [Succinivibrionaceae bacterium]